MVELALPAPIPAGRGVLRGVDSVQSNPLTRILILPTPHNQSTGAIKKKKFSYLFSFVVELALTTPLVGR